MSYDISFRAKVEGCDEYVTVGDYCLNITWNVRDIITLATGLEWKNEENNGLCVDVIPKIADGYAELVKHGKNYLKYESPNGWGTVEGTKRFFREVIDAWEDVCAWHSDELCKRLTFWIT